MKPDKWPHWIENDIWAKSAEKGDKGEPESLATHTWNVLLRLRDFIVLRASLPEQINQPGLWNLLFWSAFFHDFGKALPGFQAMLRGGERWGLRHEVFSLAFLPWVDSHLPPQEQVYVIAAIVTHHRDADEIFCQYQNLRPGEEEWLSDELNLLDQGTVSGLWRWVTECSTGWINHLGLASYGVRPLPVIDEDRALKAVLEDGAQNIRSRLTAFRRLILNEREAEIGSLVAGLLLRGHMINADHSASAHVGEYPRVQFEKGTIIQKRNLDVRKLYPHQLRSGEVQGNALLTAPTGSGKTEAALFWAAGQNGSGFSPPRLFYTLPYQASMNAMHARLQQIYGEHLVGLQHGRSRLSIYRQLMERDYDPEHAAQAANNARILARLNYPPVRVFSPYQMLKAMYRLKGYEAQLVDYYQALFVFDEIHAYEVQRLAMILKTISYLKRQFSARFFVMSATFPTLIKNWLMEALGNAIEIKASSELYHSFQRHFLEIIEGDLLEDQSLERIADEVRSGRSVLVVCNLVARAQEAYNSLAGRLAGTDIPVILMHGRFNLRDRLKKERDIQVLAGARSQRRPVLLIATQVVEVSLDIDLNTIYSDPAPLEALVQRFGRVNRARLLAELARVHVFTQPDDGQKIYDPALVAGTLEILRREAGKPIDESAIGGWLDEIYSGDIGRRWEKEYTLAAEDFENACIHTLRPFHSDDLLEEAFYKAFDSIEVIPEPLYEEYVQIKQNTPIAAGELLVPISWGRYYALVNAGLVRPREKFTPPIVKADYSSELGLSFDGPSEAEDDL